MSTTDDPPARPYTPDASAQLPGSAMDTGSDAGPPGSRAVPPDDVLAAALEDDAPLPLDAPQVGHGREGDDGLAPAFSDG